MGDSDELPDVTAPRVYGLVLRVVRAPALADPVARPTYRELWRTAAAFDVDQGSAQAWIQAIAHRRAVDRLRLVRETGRARRRATPSAGSHARHGDEGHSAEVALIGEAVARLTRGQQATLELAYFDGYTSTGANDLSETLATLRDARTVSWVE